MDSQLIIPGWGLLNYNLNIIYVLIYILEHLNNLLYRPVRIIFICPFEQINYSEIQKTKRKQQLVLTVLHIYHIYLSHFIYAASSEIVTYIYVYIYKYM